MNKLAYLKEAIRSELYKKKDWIISILSIVKTSPGRLDKPYNYMLVQSANGFEYYLDGKYLPIENVTSNVLFSLREEIKVDPSYSRIIKEETITTVGRFLVNMIIIDYPFRGNINYINDNISVGKIESMLEPILKDNPENNIEENDPSIYVEDYLRFVSALGFLAGLSQLSVQGTTERSLVAPPGITEYKKKLLEEYGDRIKDPIVFQEFENKLIEFDAQYLKGDPGAELFLSGNKNRRVVRKQMFLSMGAEPGMDDTKLPNPIINSLEEGWEVDKIPDVLNTQRSGSFSRGAATALGGELTKWLTRASANLRVEGDDCGTKLGTRVIIRENEKSRYIDRYIITDKGAILLTKDNIDSFVGKRVAIRSAMFCKNNGLTYCKTCLGKNLASNELGLSMAVSEVGSKFMGISMSAMHTVSADLVEILETDLFT